MKNSVPHYRLFCYADAENRPGYWRFLFREEGGDIVLDREDLEPDIRGARLELLTLVRALESLDHPAEITLAGGSRYLREGLRFGIRQWKENDWLWECFGRMIPVRNADLWQRVDCALSFHRVSCEARCATRPENAGRRMERPREDAMRPWVRQVARRGGTGGPRRRRFADLAGTFATLLRRWTVVPWELPRRLADRSWWVFLKAPTASVRLR